MTDIITTNFTATEVLVALAKKAAERNEHEAETLARVIDTITDSSYGLSDSLADVDFEWGWYQDYEYVDGRHVSKPYLIEINGEKYEVTEVDCTGGMDQGSEASTTLKIGSQFFKKDGYYASHYGHDWDGDFYEVVPREQTITVYKRVA